MKKGTILSTIAGAALLTAAPFSLQWSQKTVTLSLDRADARIGHPLTPFSIAGVHRRAYRRAAYGTALGYGVGSYYGASGYPGYSYSSYSYPTSGYGSYASGYPGYGYGSYASGYRGFGSGFGFGSGYGSGLYASGYPSYGYGSYATGYPSYGYGGLGYRAARRVAIHHARWH